MQAMIALILCDRGPRSRSENAIDLSAIITFPCQPLLRRRNRRVGVGIAVTVLAVILFALVNAGIVIARVVAVRIRVVIVGVIVVRVVPIRPPRIESEVEDDPGSVDEPTMMSVPNVIAAAIPIALPVTRMLRDDVVPPIRRKIIPGANLACAISIASQIRIRAIFRELIRADRSARIRADGLRTELH